jgi:hypothetical protein
MPLTNKITIDAYVCPTFAHDVAADQWLVAWYLDANHYLILRYNRTVEMYEVAWKDGSTERVLRSAQYTTDASLDVWTQITACLDISAASATGSALYINRVAVDTNWGGNCDVLASTFPVM